MAGRRLQYEQYLLEFEHSRNLECLRAAFHVLDEDSDGLVSKSEYLGILGRDKSAEKKVEQAFTFGDINRDGFLNEAEYLQMMQELAMYEDQQLVRPERRGLCPQEQEVKRLVKEFRQTRNQSHLETAFRLLDLNGDGVISKAELRASYLVRGFPNEEWVTNFLVRLADVNNDGTLSLEEFRNLVLR